IAAVELNTVKTSWPIVASIVLIVHDCPREQFVIDGAIIREEPLRDLDCPRLQWNINAWRGFACRRPRLQASELCHAVRGAEPSCVRMLSHKIYVGNKQIVWHETEEP
ncbi:MAG: hypothetical protein ACKPKO_56760, partial [Candidatus Fonsibacter sp.]